MKANELRIGNLVNIGYDASIARLMENSCYINTHKSEKRLIEFIYDRLRPIPLDEAWLIKMGFNRHEFKDCVQYEFPGNTDLDFINYVPKTESFHFNSWENSNQPKYVHQLQNLYHTLTGEELTVSE